MSSALTFGLRRWVSQEMRDDIAEQEARDVEHVDADIGDDEAFFVVEIGLCPVDVEAGAEGDARPARRADRAESIILRTARSGAWKRKFSCTASQTPAFLAASTIAVASSQVGAKGFWTMVETPCAMAVSAIARCVSCRVTMSTASSFSAAEHRLDVGVPGHAEILAGGLRLGGIDIADGGERGAFRREIAPGMEMVLCIEAAADDADADGFARHRSARDQGVFKRESAAETAAHSSAAALNDPHAFPPPAWPRVAASTIGPCRGCGVETSSS